MPRLWGRDTTNDENRARWTQYSIFALNKNEIIKTKIRKLPFNPFLTHGPDIFQPIIKYSSPFSIQIFPTRNLKLET
jgi:hypothetical protein